MTSILYGRPPAVFEPPTAATQTSPLIPGSAALEDLAPGSLDGAMVYAPPGVVERRYTLALTLRALKPGGRLDVMAHKDKGGSRLKKELLAFSVAFEEAAKAHHRRAIALRPETLTGVDEAIAAGGPQRIGTPGVWTQPGVFAWDRIDPGSALLLQHLPELSGSGADLGCGWGALAPSVLRSSKVTGLRLVDLDRRAVEAAKRNIDDPRATFEWSDARLLPDSGDLDFIVANPPFHDGGAEDRRLGQAFIRKAAAMLKPGGVLWVVANRHLPYENEINAVFKRMKPVADTGGYKVLEATR